MDQKLINTLGQIAFLARSHKGLRDSTPEAFALWVSTQLAESFQIFTRPVGANYFHLCEQEEYERYRDQMREEGRDFIKKDSRWTR